jgi:hypothetical protein
MPIKSKYNSLSTTDREYLAHVYFDDKKTHEEKISILRKKFNISERTVRRWWKDNLSLSRDYSSFPPELIKARKRKLPKNTDVILFTSAQNKTSINTWMLDSMLTYKAFLEKKGKTVEIVIAPARYRNPTSPSESKEKDSEEWWVDEVMPYIYYNKIEFGDVLISADSRIRPTVKNPLTSYEVLCKDRHLVLPHPKTQFKTLPRFKNKPLRTMCSSGYLSEQNYSLSKAGETAQEHHSFGFVIIEKKDDDACYIPRIVKVRDDGIFTDIIYEVGEDVKVIEESEALVMGDIHAEVLNRAVFDNTLELMKVLKPKEVVLHDLFDGSTVNPHERKDVYINRRKIIEGKYLLQKELDECFEVVQELIATGAKVNIVISNHDVFLDRHINDVEWKKDLHNSVTYLELAQIFQSVDLSKYGSIFGYLLVNKFKEVRYINYNESLEFMGYECGTHGDFGNSGTKGNYKSFAKVNTKMIIAHMHSPTMYDGVTVVGVTCNLDQYYTRRGMSSWAYAHSVVHSSGKNQLLVFGDDYSLSSLI